jgi:hypothetical protein
MVQALVEKMTTILKVGLEECQKEQKTSSIKPDASYGRYLNSLIRSITE